MCPRSHSLGLRALPVIGTSRTDVLPLLTRRRSTINPLPSRNVSHAACCPRAHARIAIPRARRRCSQRTRYDAALNAPPLLIWRVPPVSGADVRCPALSRALAPAPWPALVSAACWPSASPGCESGRTLLACRAPRARARIPRGALVRWCRTRSARARADSRVAGSRLRDPRGGAFRSG